METVGARIKAARQRAGLSQEKLACEIKAAKSTISKYEKGLRQPRIEQLQAIANTLGVSISYLTGEPIRLDFPMPDYPARIPTKEEIERMSPMEQEYYYLRLLADTAPDQLKRQLTDSYDKLNKLGQVEAVRRTAELSENPKYTEPDRNNAPSEDK